MTSPQLVSLDPTSGRTARQRDLVWPVITFLVFLGWTIAFQIIGGAYRTEFSGHPDEPAHYITGLMIRDYIASGFSTTPMKYAENYYLHYPKVAFGMWGPLPHVVEGVWMMLFSPDRISILMLMALIVTSLAYAFSTIIKKEFNATAAFVAGIAFLSITYVQTYAGMVMADNLCALMDLLAIIYFGRYLDHQRRRDSILFGTFACLSILTKGNGFALALIPPIAILLTRRFDLLKQRSFWFPALMVAVFVGPWQYVSSRLLSGSGFRYRSWEIAAAYGSILLNIVGPWLLVLVLAGIYARIVRPFRQKAIAGVWASAAAFIPAFWVFHSCVPSAGAEPRYAVAVTGPILMFLIAGMVEVATVLPLSASLRAKASIVAVATAAIFAGTAFAIPRKAVYGFVDAAAAIRSRSDLRDGVMLVSSEGDGEGMLIAEVAMHEQRPGHIILRASKMLARSDWDGNQYEPLQPTPEAVMTYLDSVPVQVLVIDSTWRRQPLSHHRSLIKMLALYSNRWERLGSFSAKSLPPGAGSIEVYKRVGLPNQPRSKIQVDLRYTLGRSIEEK